MTGIYNSFYIYGYEDIYYLFISIMTIIILITIFLILKETKKDRVKK